MNDKNYYGKRKRKRKNKNGGQSNSVENIPFLPVKLQLITAKKAIKKIIHRAEATHYNVYHIWLDCLYEVDLDHEDFFRDMTLLFGIILRNVLKRDHVFVAGITNSNGQIVPAGHCHILLPRSLEKELELSIFEGSVHMKKDHYYTLRQQLTDGRVFMFVQPAPPSPPLPPVRPPPQPFEPKTLNNFVSTSSKNPKPPKPPQPAEKKTLVSASSKDSKPAKPPQPAEKKTLVSASSKDPKPPKPSQPSVKVANGAKDPAHLESILSTYLEEDNSRKYVSQVLPKLQSLGNVVIRVDNLPAKLTIDNIRLMMGSYTLTSDQVLAAVILKKNGLHLMNLRMVFRSGNSDIDSILGKNSLRTAYDTQLVCKRTDFKELEQFILKNYASIRELQNEISSLPMNTIAYGKSIKV